MAWVVTGLSMLLDLNLLRAATPILLTLWEGAFKALSGGEGRLIAGCWKL
jgi:hypothetical protein